MRKARLVRYRGNELQEQIVLMEDKTTIGRDLGNHVQLTDRKVSKKHAVIEPAGRYWTIRDLDSTNGVFVNGGRVKKSAVLQKGDVVRLGNTDYIFDVGTGEEWQAPLTVDVSENAAMRTLPGGVPPARR